MTTRTKIDYRVTDGPSHFVGLDIAFFLLQYALAESRDKPVPTEFSGFRHLETFTIPDNDERVALRGTTGMRVRPYQRGEAGQFFGILWGMVWITFASSRHCWVPATAASLSDTLSFSPEPRWRTKRRTCLQRVLAFWEHHQTRNELRPTPEKTTLEELVFDPLQACGADGRHHSLTLTIAWTCIHTCTRP